MVRTNRTLYPASILGSGTLPTTSDPPLDASNLTSRSTYALRASQKALRMYPGHLTNWAVFVSAVTANGIAVESVTREKGLHRLALKLSRYVSSKASQEKDDLLQSLGTRPSGSHASLADAVYKWTVLHTGYCLLNCGLTQEALQHCEQVLAAYSDVPQLSTDVHFLKDRVLLQMGDSLETGLNSLQASVLSSPHHSAHAWELVAQVQSKLGAPMAAELCYRQCLQAGSGKRSTSWRLVPLIRLALLALQQIQANEANRERWEALCTEASTEVLKLDPSCTAARLIQAVAQCILGNTRSARRSLQCVCDTKSAASLVARYWLLQLPSK
ncbi:tetratricopeptide repeat protein 37-like [Nematostella vectensis]|uniref:tetratricopeptide repeat protein 37-like n=1 Tax=Nematostella vectensis TaxID=45351 RepID=UPI0020772E49|nr:tetratricopeptide repeat protein 37-like [Nematostella vectensis]